MAKRRKTFDKNKIIRFAIIVVIVLLILFAGFFLYNRFIKPHNYRIVNKYYGFELQTPNSWFAKQNTSYYEDVIDQIIADNKNNKTNNSGAEIGAFRFESSKYPDDFLDSGVASSSLPSGSILEVDVFYTPNVVGGGINSSGNIKIAGIDAVDGSSDSPIFGKVENISFYHNDLQYKINEFVYISPTEKNKENIIRSNDKIIFDKIISSFKLLK